MNDTLIIYYSTNKSTTWNTLAIISKADLDNKGSVATAYTPTTLQDWAPKSLSLPSGAISPYTTFRFRYKPNVSYPDAFGNTYTTGNNFYMDNIYFSAIPASINSLTMGKVDVALVPNPTNGDAYVVVKDADNTTADVTVTDITGKVVYTTSQQVAGETHILLPHSYIAVKGLYMVQTVTGNQVHTQKLVVY
jgi:hypothetical protein